ncbi:MAG TPA: CinA family nicotinamide mononucleotide deamidase-related protein, partial [Bacteroidia bacterium]|nr:CinA family nicotinamide mononucleotide deamidase-related protein [Bacteroidia bacterium]
NLNGISIKQISSVSDNREHIVNALDEAKERADIILITGGLGPTKDDITKKTLCEYFNTTMRFDETAYEDVVAIFASFNKEVTPINRKQAEVPAICDVLRNHNGTAPGMWFDVEGKVFVSMPGVPFEMKALMTDEVVPRLKARFKFPEIFHKTVLTQGIGESSLSELISDWEDQLANVNIKLAYLPSPGLVRLRLSTSGTNAKKLRAEVERQITALQKIAGQYIYGYETYGEEKKTMEELVAALLKKTNTTVATAESCTGGYISHLLTTIPGSSSYYIGSIISYAYEIKENELNISKEVLTQHGAVSQIVVEQMAQTIQKKFKSDYAIATSGIAGPTGGTAEKPVGTVWIAVATPEKIISKKFQFGNNRERTIQKSAHASLNMLKDELEKISVLF